MSTHTEHEHAINGVQGLMFASHVRDATRGTFSTQTWKASREYRDAAKLLRMTVELRFDDNCANGHNTFSVTCSIDESAGKRWRDYGGGAAHDEIAKVFPELAHVIKWHLVSSDGPMHYLANTIYMAGDLDHNGLAAGERRQRVTNSGKLMWELVADIGDGTMLNLPEKHVGETVVALHVLKTLHTGENPPATPHLRWQPCYQTGEGKARELDHARSAAVWLDATDNDLTAPGLKERLMARLPALLTDFRATMESIGFDWESQS